MNKTAQDILKFLTDSQIDYKWNVDPNLLITNVKSMENLGDGSIGFYEDKDIKKYSHLTNENNLVVVSTWYLGNILKGNYIYVDDPRVVFVKIINKLLNGNVEPQWKRVSKYAGENVIIERGAKIGKNVKIGHNSVIKNGTVIGDNVTIHSNTVIGESGFGYVTDKDGTRIKFPHIGGVIIEDNVEIHSNVCIDRGTLDNTIIRKGAKIDNLVHIAHNVEIGENTFVIAQSMIGGSVKIGNNCWIAPGSIIRDGLKIGDNVTIGLGSVVTKNIPNNETWLGLPAKKWRKQ